MTKTTRPVGFGGTSTKPAPKKGNPRQEKAKQFEEMKQQGLPEFNIFVRLPDRNWLPAGVMTVQRSNQIERAIFQQEAELKKNIVRLMPKLQKSADQLEFGYRYKQFPDEPIVLAKRPQAPNQWWQKLGKKFIHFFRKP
jgi:hypothetical protein